MQLVEIRAELRKVPDLERISVLHDAVDRGETIVFEAISEWPESLGPLVPAGMLEDARQRWAEKKNPTLAARVRKLSDLFERYESTLRTVRQSIERIGGIQRDAIELLDAKGSAA